MAAAGIREAGDIDLLVTEDVLEQLKHAGWQELRKSANDRPLTHEVFEAHADWNFSSYSSTLSVLLSSATIVEGVPFASLDKVRKWKAASGRPKDKADIDLIDRYQERPSK